MATEEDNGMPRRAATAQASEGWELPVNSLIDDSEIMWRKRVMRWWR